MAGKRPLTWPFSLRYASLGGVIPRRAAEEGKMRPTSALPAPRHLDIAVSVRNCAVRHRVFEPKHTQRFLPLSVELNRNNLVAPLDVESYYGSEIEGSGAVNVRRCRTSEPDDPVTFAQTCASGGAPRIGCQLRLKVR